MHIKWRSLVIIPVLFLFVGCGGNENDKNDYSGVGKLISDRNKARIKKASSNAQEKNDSSPYSPEDKEPKKPEKRYSGMTFEEEVKIVSIRSGETIAKATAYLDKSGKLVTIRIRKEQ